MAGRDMLRLDAKGLSAHRMRACKMGRSPVHLARPAPGGVHHRTRQKVPPTHMHAESSGKLRLGCGSMMGIDSRMGRIACAPHRLSPASFLKPTATNQVS